MFWRRTKGAPLQPMTDADRDALRAEFARRDRLAALDAG
jgi:hypothetical protein